jgi:hypothetical protein
VRKKKRTRPKRRPDSIATQVIKSYRRRIVRIEEAYERMIERIGKEVARRHPRTAFAKQVTARNYNKVRWHISNARTLGDLPGRVKSYGRWPLGIRRKRISGAK